MLSAERLLEQIEAHLLGTGGVPDGEASIVSDPGDFTGKLDIDLVFPSGHRLSVLVVVVDEVLGVVRENQPGAPRARLERPRIKYADILEDPLREP